MGITIMKLALVATAVTVLGLTATPSLLAQPPAAEYEYLMEEGSGTTVANTGTAGTLDGTFVTSAAFSTDVPGPGAGNFSVDVGQTGYIEVGDASNAPFPIGAGQSWQDFTVSLWFNSDRTASSGYIAPIGKANATSEGGFYGPRAHGGIGVPTWHAGVYEGGQFRTFTSTHPVESANSVQANTWYQLTWVSQNYGETQTIYIDNDGSSGTGIVGSRGNNAVVPLRLGDTGWSGNFDGKIDHVRIWDEALTAENVAWLYAEMFGTSPSPSLDFAWNVDSFGAWTTASNWNPALAYPGDPNGSSPANHTATFGSVITSNRTVSTDTDVSVRVISFDNSNTYAIAGTGSVNLIAATVAGLPTEIAAFKGTHQFQAAVNLHTDTTVNVASSSTLIFNNALNLNNSALTKTGAGEIAIRNDFLTSGGTLNCDEGTCSGSGTISGDVNNGGGTISPGNSPGVMAIEGDFVPEPSTLLLAVCGLISWVACRRSI